MPGGGEPSGGSNGSGSNAGSNAGGSVDAGTGGTAAACTGAPYDPCTDNTQCMAGSTCQTFAGAGIEVCTVTCTPGDNTTCPMQNGAPAQCNNMGTCKPPAANSCTR